MFCPKCGSENTTEGFLSGNYLVHFIKKGTENKFRPESYRVECHACLDCGHVFEMQLIFKPKKGKEK